nr:MAG TPA: RNA polymerase sigma factor [Caudoviricetes sp.]
MTTKEYLNRAYVLNKKIKKDKEIIANLKDAAMNTSANVSDERVQTSAPTGSRMSTFVEMIVELENSVNKQEEELKVVRDEITTEINKITDIKQRLVLQLRYLDYYSWSNIAGVLCCSESLVYKIHSDGLKNL